jgi:hypothetical protein
MWMNKILDLVGVYGSGWLSDASLNLLDHLLTLMTMSSRAGTDDHVISSRP